MKIKKMLSALLAAAMMCSLLCLPAFAAGKDDVLNTINSNSFWVDVKDVDSLKADITLKMRGWNYSSSAAAWTTGETSDTLQDTVIKLPLGVTITAGPNNAFIYGIAVYTADQDGVYVERLERITTTDEGYDHDVLPLSTTGTLQETDTVEYFSYFDWGWGVNRLLYSEYNGYRSLTTDFLVELFGANSLIVFLDADGKVGDTYYLLTGEKRPASLAFDNLADYGIFFADGTDVVSQWAVEPVSTASSAGLLRYGMEANHNFDLTGKITRAEFARLAVDVYYALTGKQTPDESGFDNPFEDVKDDSTLFASGILVAYDLGIVTGKTDTLFRPEALVTRQEAAAMLARAYTKATGEELPTITATTFADDTDIQSYARDAVAFMAEHEIINGVGSNRFNPKGDASVEQALKIAVEMLDKLGK